MRMKPLTEERLATMTPDEIVEEGVGLIARGMYREGHMHGRATEAAEMGEMMSIRKSDTGQLTSIAEIESEIRRLETRLQEAKEEGAKLGKLSPERRLAIALHENLCTLNHIDQCFWEYEDDSDPEAWASWTRQEYENKARKILNVMHLTGATHKCKNDIEFITKLLTAL